MTVYENVVDEVRAAIDHDLAHTGSLSRTLGRVVASTVVVFGFFAVWVLVLAKVFVAFRDLF